MPSAIDDHELMLAVQAGHRPALATLFDRHHRPLYGFFRKLGQVRSDSEDLVQETFMRVLRHASTYDPAARFGPWFYRIARNVLHDRLRPGAATLEDVDALELIAAPQYEPGRISETRELGTMLERALQRLPRERRELILLSRVRLLSNEDLAALYDCSTGAVKVRLHRSLEQLRQHFDDLMEVHDEERS